MWLYHQKEQRFCAAPRYQSAQIFNWTKIMVDDNTVAIVMSEVDIIRICYESLVEGDITVEELELELGLDWRIDRTKKLKYIALDNYKSTYTK
jgi:hypothetical protein